MIGLAATVREGDSGSSGVTYNQRPGVYPAGRIADDNRAVGGTFLGGPEGESVPVGRDPDILADRVDLQGGLAGIHLWRFVAIAVI